MTGSPTDLSRSDRNALRAFVRGVRDGRTATFDGRRIGDANERTLASNATVIARETHDAALELVVEMADDDAPATLPEVGDEAAALAETLVEALNDALDTTIAPSAVAYADAMDAYVVRVHLPSRTLS